MNTIYILVASFHLFGKDVLILGIDVHNGATQISYAGIETCEETVKNKKRFEPDVDYKCVEAAVMYGQADADRLYQEWKSQQDIKAK